MSSSRYAMPWLAALIVAAAMGWHGPIAQLAHYHEFADQRDWLLPHAADVFSNLGFAIAGSAGLAPLLRNRTRFGPSWGACVIFMLALLATAFGSSWYHLAPDDARLVWDRLPIALACAALMAAVCQETTGAPQWVLPVWIASAVASVTWWNATCDLRPYLLLQALAMIAAPLLQWAYRSPSADRRALGWALAGYGVAKLCELADHPIFVALGVLSGHTLKHLFATAAAAVLVARIRARCRENAFAPS